MGGHVPPQTTYDMLEAVSHLSCVTNWEKAKILHRESEAR
jgi:hypothetical protein